MENNRFFILDMYAMRLIYECDYLIFQFNMFKVVSLKINANERDGKVK